MIDYEIDPETHVVRARLSDHVSVAEMLETIAVYSLSHTILTTTEVCNTLLKIASSRIIMKGFRDMKRSEDWIESCRLG